MRQFRCCCRVHPSRAIANVLVGSPELCNVRATLAHGPLQLSLRAGWWACRLPNNNIKMMVLVWDREFEVPK